MPAERRIPRVQRACTYCKHRKMKCTGERPRCKNCEIYDQECVIAPVVRKSRPTNAAISSLVEENRRLREQSRSLTDVSPDSQAEPSPVNPSPPMETISPASASVSTRGEKPTGTPTSVTGTSTYHGPTSTLFDDGASRQSQFQRSKERDAWMPKILVAAAAEQRQYEEINARAGKLDFDGVDPELGLHLLNLHWNRQHHSFLVTYRPAFMRDMACAGPYFSKILLNAIYYGAAKFSPRPELRKEPTDVRTAGWQFRNRVRDLLGQALDHSEITTIQALLQMSNSLFALGDEQSAAWVYAGTAFRMLVDLGLHVDAAMLPNMQRISEEDLEIRRRVYWAAFVIDKMQSLYQGRPASLRPPEGQVPISFMDTYEELEAWHPFAHTSGTSHPGSPSYSVSTFTELCKLCIILHDVLDRMYCEGRPKRNTEDVLRDLESLEARTQDWRASLPTHLHIDLSQDNNQHIPPPHVFSLQTMWNALRILLHRPLVADGHLHLTLPSTSKSSFAACTEAAMNIVKLVRLYDKSFSVKRAPYLISYATYVAATIHVRIAATRASNSDAHEHLRTCLSVFEQNSETNHAVRKAQMVIEALMKRMEVSFGEPRADEGRPSPSQGSASTNVQLTPSNNMPPYPQSLQPARVAQNQGHVRSSLYPEPTMVAGEFVPGLDVDAIINSFMQEQQSNGPIMYTVDQNYVNGPGQNYEMLGNVQDQTVNGAYFSGFDDTLFGFNTSAFQQY